MKKVMAALFCAFAVVLTLGLGTLAVEQAFGDSCLDCPVCCHAFFFSASPSSANAPGGSFDYNQTLNWAFNDDDQAGVDGETGHIIAVHDDPNVDYGTVTYTPSIFFGDDAHNCCAGVLTVNTTGDLFSTSSAGNLHTRASIGNQGPVNKTVTITRT